MKNPDQLIADYLDDALIDSEQAELNAWLKADAANIQRFAEAVMFEQQIRASAQAKAQGQAAAGFEAPAQPAPPRPHWQSWRPPAAAAAGLLIGLFSASLVYGLVTRRQVWTQTLMSEGFEDAEIPRDSKMPPAHLAIWSGDFQAPQGATGDVRPAEGSQMLTLLPVDKRLLSYAFRFVDLSAFTALRAEQSCEIEVTARFHGAVPDVRDRFQIRLATFAEEVEVARKIWNKNYLDEMALLHVAKTVVVPSNTNGWTTLRVTMDVPADARLLLVALAAGVADTDTPNTVHYLDDVQVRLSMHDARP